MKILPLAHKLEKSYAKTWTFNHSKRKNSVKYFVGVVGNIGSE